MQASSPRRSPSSRMRQWWCATSKMARRRATPTRPAQHRDAQAVPGSPALLTLRAVGRWASETRPMPPSERQLPGFCSACSRRTALLPARHAPLSGMGHSRWAAGWGPFSPAPPPRRFARQAAPARPAAAQARPRRRGGLTRPPPQCPLTLWCAQAACPRRDPSKPRRPRSHGRLQRRPGEFRCRPHRQPCPLPSAHPASPRREARALRMRTTLPAGAPTSRLIRRARPGLASGSCRPKRAAPAAAALSFRGGVAAGAARGRCFCCRWWAGYSSSTSRCSISWGAPMCFRSRSGTLLCCW
mmetsp:Transcript_403/g.1440  ORF Transcript_403/g.1440 Transcript_403/m.1440 type:complete len:300 (+) Transcript_403:590-1489(+)